MPTPTREHALLSPSSAHRWLLCAGSVALAERAPALPSKYADEGTDAHQLAAMSLLNGKDPEAYLGRVLDKGFTADADMVAGVDIYVKHILEYRGDDDTLLVEQALPIGHITGEEGAEGTGDAVIISADCEEIQVHDLKFGKGVKVFAERNPQLMFYALGALGKFSLLGDFKRVRLVIHQPRLDHLDEWDCPIEELSEFASLASDRAKVAMTAYEYADNWIGKDNAYLTPGESQCRFCPAKATCPAVAQLITATVFEDFDERVTVKVPDDREALGRYWRRLSLIRDWCNAIEETVLAENLAGNTVAGTKLVLGRKGNRAWGDEAEVERLLKAMRLKQDEMYVSKLISPTKAEELLKEQPKRWKAIAPFIRQAEPTPMVVPAEDRREEFKVTPSTPTEFHVPSAADLV